MLFTGGPCTIGPGAMASLELSEPLRSHTDLHKDQATFYRSSQAYFAQLAERSSNLHHSIDIFSCALDQVGLIVEFFFVFLSFCIHRFYFAFIHLFLGWVVRNECLSRKDWRAGYFSRFFWSACV